MPRQEKPPRLKQYGEHWYVVYAADGRSKRKALRTTDFQTAQLRFAGWLEGKEQAETVEADPTIERCLQLWMDQWVSGRMITQNRYPSIINNLNTLFGKLRVSQVTREHAKQYAKLRFSGRIGTSKAATGTVRLELQRLRACLTFMQKVVEPREQRLRPEIIPHIDLPDPSPPRERVLSEDEIILLRDVCSHHVDNGQGRRRTNRMSRVSRFIMLAMETAQRKTAICELKWDQVNFERKQIQFNPAGRLQTKKRRPALSISPILLPFLERVYAERVNDYVLDNPRGIYEQVKRLGDSLGIDGLHPHVFRHTWATRAVMRGVPLNKVAIYLGDTIKTVEKNYAHYDPHYLDDVHENW